MEVQNIKDSIIKCFVFVCLLSFIAGCSNSEANKVQYIDVPTEVKSSEPSLMLSSDHSLYLSWIETDSSGLSQLRFSKLTDDDTWSEPNTIAGGKNWFVNWADFPSLTAFGQNNMVAHYLEKSAADTYAYDVKLTISNDEGKSWNSSFSPHDDQTNTEHGFVSKLDISNDRFMSVWLDGRQYAYAAKDSTLTKEMTLRSAIINSKGEILKEHVIDDRVCDCCQTDITMTSQGPMVVYRDRSDKEIRDIYFSIYKNENWSVPKVVNNDNWYIPGCPVNGPAIASSNSLTAISWYTVSNQLQKVKMAFLASSGEFSEPIDLNYVNPLGRVDIEILNADQAVVSWMDNSNERSKIMLQVVDRSGQKSAAFTVSDVSEERSSGFPRMILKDDYLYITWTEVGTQLKVKSAKINTAILSK
ncbi:MAG: exo-alpha-sialidase [Bacteroidia bacterium]|nr:exo-alpha-sialidase [Bacteroidia bacterium]NND24531.1 exo-alpha-sialidase [Flavobacteriaceae bacterium]NNK60198.1 exo-alpha-sialidase [Flavobacteriaceae bacterium]RZW53630.1 MAG: exo-alpha-sialidase [Flavobacteriaceae bacterium]